MMNKLFLLLTIAIQFTTLLEAQSVVNSSFVQVKGNQLILENKPYYFCGTNLWYGYYLGSKGITGNRERLLRELDRLVELGFTNLRILASSEASEFEGSLTPAIQTSKGIYNEELLDGLDYLLSEMDKRNMKGVLYLNNFWVWSGGMSQYLFWSNGKAISDPSKGDWNKFYDAVSLFYTNKSANSLWYKYIKMLINRENTYTGKQYKDDPAIMAWQLSNEPRGGEGLKGMKNIEEFYRWVDQSAAFIHALDKNHLVSSGGEGTMGTKGNSEIFEKAYQSKNIDYLTFHLWAHNWGWFEAKKYAETLPISKTKAAKYINDHIELARKMGKPIVMEEFGLDRDSSMCMPGTSITARDEYFQFVLNLVAESAKSNLPLMGSNFWGWAGEAVPVSADGKVLSNSPFLADPWLEAQGLNSVYNTDQTTLNILKEHCRRIKSANNRR